jgi:glycosyltransferase involved in cell wall biosynthesis
VRISVVASELPHPQGTAAGRDLYAWCEGLRALGHDLDAWLWRISPVSPRGPIPGWCSVEPFDVGPMWQAHLHALRWPRGDLARAGWRAPDEAIVVADHIWSYAGADYADRSVATFHFRTTADALAARRFEMSTVQMARAERIAGRRAKLVLAYSDRVGRHLRRPATFVPIAYPAPPCPLPAVEAPVAAMLADWSWPPNVRALRHLLGAWPTVHDALPQARLLLAGRCLESVRVGQVPGVELLGEFSDSADILSEAAVVAFPCPPSSGPKVKVLEALAHGLPVVTTRWGVEGIVLDEGGGVVTADLSDFPSALVELLRDPDRRVSLGAAGRESVLAHHSGQAAALARLDAFSAAFGS